MMGKAAITRSVVFKTVIISSILLATFLTLLQIWGSKIITADKILMGLKLLIFWVLITATLRSEVKVRQHIGGLWLLITGLLVAGLGVILHLLLLQVIPAAKNGEGMDWGLSFETLRFYLAIGFAASVISLINIKVKSEFWGNVLEVLFVAILVGLFLWVGY